MLRRPTARSRTQGAPTLALRSVAPTQATTAALVAVIVWAALEDLGLPLWLPYRPRQVPEWLRDALPPGAIALLYGLMLGFGFLTLFTYSTHLSVLIALPELNSAGAMLAVLVALAAGKCIVLAIAVGAPTIDVVGSRFHWTAGRARVLRLSTASASLTVAATLASSLIK